MVIIKTAGKNIAIEMDKIGETVFQAKLAYIVPRVEGEGLPLELESLEDLGRNFDLYVFNQDVE